LQVLAKQRVIYPRGPELGSVTDCKDNKLQKSQIPGGAESGAFSGTNAKISPDLARLIEAWPTLPAHIKQSIIAFIEIAQSKKKQNP